MNKGEGEYYCSAAAMQDFIETVHQQLDALFVPAGGGPGAGDALSPIAPGPGRAVQEQLVQQLRPAFSALLSDPSWLPPEFRAANPLGGMGGGIASWLLYRSARRDLTLMSLVVPAGSQTPIHDHLAWGLVGMYQGEQDEDVFRRTDDAGVEGVATLSLIDQRRLPPGSFYELLPPEGDIHRVRTTSAEASISIHLLGNDVGCVLRHSFEPSIEAVAEFRSGYSNVSCDGG